jgi:plastocyanin
MALDTRRSPILGWERLVVFSGLAALVVLAVVAAVNGDLEAGAVAAGFAISLGLLRFRRGLLGKLGVGLLSAVTLFFMLTAAITNVGAGSPVGAVLLSGGLASIALSGLMSAIASVASRKSATGTGPGPLYLIGASVLLFVGLGAWAVANGDPTISATEATLVADNVAFSRTDLTARAGDVTVSLANQDLFWHTFTIESLDVDLPVPVGGTRSVTFNAEPGTYEFKCRIPGHPEAGMIGTLTVSG